MNKTESKVHDIHSTINWLNKFFSVSEQLLNYLRLNAEESIHTLSKSKRTIELVFFLKKPLTPELYEEAVRLTNLYTNTNNEYYLFINFAIKQSLWTPELIQNCIQDICRYKNKPAFFLEKIECIDDRTHEIVFANQNMKAMFDESNNDIVDYLDKLGFHDIKLTSRFDLELANKKQLKEKQKELVMTQARKITSKEKPKYPSLEECIEYNKIPDSSEITPIIEFDQNEPTSLTTLWAKIYQINYVENPNFRRIKIGLADRDSAILIFDSLWNANYLSSDYINQFKVGDWVKIQVRVRSSRDQKLYTYIERLEKADVPEWLKPTPEDYTDRHEFFFHTKMSAHDGLNDVNDLKKFCEENQIKDIAITDTGVVQSFPDLVSWKTKLSPEIKVHYGLEIDVFDDTEFIVKNNKDLNLEDLTFVVYDIETTGLNAYYEQIIEIGATRIKTSLNKTNNQLEFTVLDKFEKFIKNEKPLSELTTNLTKIKDSDLADAEDEKTVLNQFMNFIQKNDVLVAHNGIDFDFIWVNTKLDKYNLGKLDNPMLDTLRLAYQLYRYQRYSLENLSKKLDVEYDKEAAHRANYDTEVLSKCLIAMLSNVYAKNWRSLLDLNDKQKLVNDIANLKVNKKTDSNDQEESNSLLNENLFNRIRARKALLYAKNQKGLKALYKLVSLASTDQFYGTPKLFWSDIKKYEDDILVSSHPLNGHIVHAAKYDTEENLVKIIKNHNFVQIPLPSLFRKEISKGNIEQEHVYDLINRIIKICEQENILYTFSSLAHYLRKEQKKFYDCLITTEMAGKRLHHFYDRELEDKNRRELITPYLHIRKKMEVYNDFNFIKEPNILAKLIHQNGAKISQLFDDDKLLPYPQKLHPPKIEGSDEKLQKLVWDKADELFGQQIDPIIKSRIEYELNAIIGNGYGIVYWLAHLLVKKSNDDGYIVGSRGSVGSSIVALLAGISEVNPLEPYYYCKKCKKTEFINDIDDGYDLVNKPCINPSCDGEMKGEGHNIPFASFMGFNGEKIPDIDLNFSSLYQLKAHDYVKEMFGESHTARSGTISTMQEKTARKFVYDYFEKLNRPEDIDRLTDWYASEITEIKRTTGQHPGGILVFPKDMEIEDFCPINYPADDKSSNWKTSHFKYEYLHDTLLKLDILSQEDPTILKFLYDVTNVKAEDIPNNDKDVLSLFNLEHCLDFSGNDILANATGALGIPEFGTKITRDILKIAKPASFADLIRVSGLSHGTDVWAGNAADLILEKNYKLNEVIACRDDIMTYLSSIGIDKKIAFSIMEDVRKGKKLKPQYEEIMREFKVSEDYIDSCNKIKYMFPKAHATAYVLMAWKIAWFKVHHPSAFYAAIFSFKIKEHDILPCVTGGINEVMRLYKDISTRIEKSRRNNTNAAFKVTEKEKDLLSTYEVYIEMLQRNIKLEQVSLEHSDALNFVVKNNKIYPPFNVIPGLGEEIAKLIVKSRNESAFKSQADLKTRCKLSKKIWDYFTEYKVFGDLKPDEKIRLY
ncbi:PolC-type DNA polymerase III [Mycoplasma bradburyae]|uniref:PolC-type DNA polymerase III n=1 Tax=Mycoplasma bradburyae TaxID=2963128 RepID=UPI0020CCE3E3|nr:PolC-type DNA polymerase III [Mycoplasma bradburyae]UTS70944.1 PolC-type DNA polymerase III [Mycoplasma bradburyae]